MPFLFMAREIQLFDYYRAVGLFSVGVIALIVSVLLYVPLVRFHQGKDVESAVEQGVG